MISKDILCRLAGAVGLALIALWSAPPLQAQQVTAVQTAPSEEAALWSAAVGHMRSGAPEAALPLLEKLVSQHPDKAQYRLELGLALLQTGKNGRARYHVDLARLGAANDIERRAAKNLLAAIDAKRVWSGYFQLNIQPETNAGKQTSEESLTLAGLDFKLDQNARATASTSTILATGVTYAPKLRDGLTLKVALDFWGRQNADDRLKDRVLTLRVGPQIALAPGRTLEFGASVGRRWLASDPVDNLTGLYLSYGRGFGPKGYGSATLTRTWAESLDGTPDEIDTSLRLSYAHALNPTTILRGHAAFLRKDNPIAQVRYDEAQLGIGAQKLFKGGWQVMADLKAARRVHDGEDRIFLETRTDERLSLDFGVLHRDFRIGPFVPELRIGAERNRSTISFYDYDNEYMTVRFTRQF